MVAQRGGRNFLCKTCGRQFKRRKTLTIHSNSCFKHICTEQKISRNGKILLNKMTGEPQKCGKILITKQGLIAHKKAHNDWDLKREGKYKNPDKTFRCQFKNPYVVEGSDQCLHVFKNEHNLKVDHEPYCPYNPNRLGPFYCPNSNCERSKGGKGRPLTRPKDLNCHMRKYHQT